MFIFSPSSYTIIAANTLAAELSKTVDPIVQEENMASLRAMGIQEVCL